MKNYFDFTLTGGKLFLTFIIYLIVCFVPAIWIQVSASDLQAQAIDHNALMNYYAQAGIAFLIITLAVPVLYLFLVKLFAEGLVYKGETLKCDFSVGHYLGIVIGGWLLSIITLGIYYPWFLTRIIRYFGRHTTYRGEPFDFQGKGLTLLGIILLSFVLPTVLVILVFVLSMGAMATGGSPAGYGLTMGVVLLAFVICVIALEYLMYRWMVDFKYGPLHIGWNTQTLHAVGFLLGQIVLYCITLGLYGPAALIRIYRYFVSRTEATENGAPARLWGYDAQIGRDYWYILGQGLLAMITLGIYAPWALTKITRRLVSNTYLKPASEE